MREQNRHQGTRLLIIFVPLAIFSIASILFEFYQMHLMYRVSANMYEHPLKVSNTALQLQLKVLKIRKNTKALLQISPLSENATELLDETASLERAIDDDLQIIAVTILGEEGRALLEESRKLFDAWMPIRQKLIAEYEHENLSNDALIIRENSVFAQRCEDSVSEIYAYAYNKADGFKNEADRMFEELQIIVVVMVLILLGLFTAIAYMTWRTIARHLQKNTQLTSLLETIREINKMAVREKNSDILLQRSREILNARNLLCDIRITQNGEMQGYEWDRGIPIMSHNKTYGYLVLCSNHKEMDRGMFMLFEELAGDIGYALYYVEAEERFKKEEERYRFAIDAVQEGLWDWNPVTNEVFFSERWKTMLGYEDDELENRFENWESRLHPEDKEQTLEAVKASLERVTEYFRAVYRLRHKADHWIWIEARGKTFFDEDGKPVRMIGSHTDITTQKEYELQIVYLKELYGNTIDSVEALIFVKDTDFIYATCNSAFANFVGKSKDEIIGKSDYEIFDKETADFFRMHDVTMMSHRKSQANFEWVSYPDGHRVYLLTNKAPLTDASGNLIGLVGNSVDFTEQKKLYDQLERAQELAKLGSWEYDIAADTLTGSKEIYAIYGFADTRMKLSKESFFNHYHPDDIAMAEEAFQNSLLSKDLTVAQNRILRADTGELRYVEHRWITQYEGGIAVRTSGTTQDITELKNAEEAVKVLNEKFEKAFNNTPNLIIITRIATGEIFDVNKTFEKVTGYTRDELIGKTTFEINLWVSAEDRAAYISELMQDGSINGGTYAFNTKNNEVFVAEVYASLVTIQNERYILAIANDITQRLKIEKTLEESHRQLSALMGNLPGMAYRCRNDKKWTFEFVSDGCLELTGYEASVLIGESSVVYEDIIHPDDREHVWNTVQEGLDNDGSFEIDYRVITADGAVKWVWEKGVGVRESGDDVVLEGVILDNNARKKAEEALKEQEKLIMAQSRLAAMGEMISMIAHQWRQPLTVIAMNANNMLLDIVLDAFDIKAIEEHSQTIVDQTIYLSKTIDDFRNFFKPDKSLAKVTMKRVIEETLGIVRESLRNHNIRVQTKYDSFSEINAYPRELMQVFVNIINNAKDALVLHEKEDMWVTIHVYEDQGYVITEVCDNAGGIDEGIMTKIFDPYFTTKEKQNGTGLGLYMSKMIIDKHLEGRIEAANGEEGACFIVKLRKLSSV